MEGMYFRNYQIQSRKTAIYKEPIIYPTLGLNGEAGRVAEKVKKVLRDKNGIFSEQDREKIAKELGDILWYVSQIASDLDISLDRIAKQNLEKII